MLLTKVGTWEQTDRAPDDVALNLVLAKEKAMELHNHVACIIMFKNKMWDLESQLRHQLISAL